MMNVELVLKTTNNNNTVTRRCIRLVSSSFPLSQSTSETRTSTSLSSMPNENDVMVIRVLPIQSWGQFVLPLTAMIRYHANYILFLSLETYASDDAIEQLKLYHRFCTSKTSTDSIESRSTNYDCLIVKKNNNNDYDENVLVAGARVSEHDYHHVDDQ